MQHVCIIGETESALHAHNSTYDACVYMYVYTVLSVANAVLQPHSPHGSAAYMS